MGKPFGCLLAVGCFDEDGQICILYGLNQPATPGMAGSLLADKDHLIFSIFHPIVGNSAHGDKRQPGKILSACCGKPVQMLEVIGSSDVIKAFSSPVGQEMVDGKLPVVGVSSQ